MNTGYEWLMNIAEKDYEICLYVESQLPKEFAVRAFTYHMQQAIEKLLKALILLAGGDIEKTHSIYHLIDVCEEKEIVLPADLEIYCDTITNWETCGRYGEKVHYNDTLRIKTKDIYAQLLETVEKESKKIKETTVVI